MIPIDTQIAMIAHGLRNCYVHIEVLDDDVLQVRKYHIPVDIFYLSEDVEVVGIMQFVASTFSILRTNADSDRC